MHQPTFFRKLLIACKHLFVFRKPRLKELDFVDLLIDNKALFLVTWKMKYGYKLRIRQTRSTFFGKESGVVLLLKEGVREVDVSFCNLWRKKQVTISLKHTQFDIETKAYLLKQIRTVRKTGEVVWNTPLNQLNVHSIPIQVTRPLLAFRHPSLQPKFPTPVFNKKLGIQSIKLKYQQY